MPADQAKLRLDKWLWFARFFKTRSLAASHVAAGGVRVNGTRTSKRAATVQAGDVLTFAQGRAIRTIEVQAIAARRGPASEAQALYRDLSSPEPQPHTLTPKNPRYEGKGRPTKRDRRQTDFSRSRHLE